jgi:hypothetical protein
MPPTFVRHLIARPGEPLPPAAGLYDYVLAADGLYLRVERQGLRLCLPIAPSLVRGLAGIEPELTLTVPRVPKALTLQLLELARAERDAQGRPIEVLYHLSWRERWQLEKPRQIQSRGAVEPVGPFAGTSHATYLIEVHSHHELTLHHFSSIDDASEGSKCRLYALLSDLFATPRLALRLNAYGYRWDLPAALAFELPEALVDAADEIVDEEALPE